MAVEAQGEHVFCLKRDKSLLQLPVGRDARQTLLNPDCPADIGTVGNYEKDSPCAPGQRYVGGTACRNSGHSTRLAPVCTVSIHLCGFSSALHAGFQRTKAFHYSSIPFHHFIPLVRIQTPTADGRRRPPLFSEFAVFSATIHGASLVQRQFFAVLGKRLILQPVGSLSLAQK